MATNPNYFPKDHGYEMQYPLIGESKDSTVEGKPEVDERINYRKIEVAKETSMLKGNGKTYNLKGSKVLLDAPVPAKKDEVQGAIIEMKEFSVECEIYLTPKNMTITLPKSFFDEPFYVGMPVSLFFDESTGFRRPVIVKRELPEMKEGKIDLSEFLKEL